MKKKKKIYWGSYSFSELKEIGKLNPVVIIPVGAHEQHGPHLTIDTDTHIGVEIAEKATEKSEYPCLLLPSIWLGASGHHMNFYGTISLSFDSLRSILHDILESLSRHRIKKVLILNSHGGNIAPLSCIVNIEGASKKIDTVLLTYWDLVRKQVSERRKSQAGGISHAGELETSLKMYLRPDDVQKERFESNIVQGNEYYNTEMFMPNTVTTYKAFDDLSLKGHIGDPAVASKEFGEYIFNNVVKELCKLIDLFGRGEL